MILVIKAFIYRFSAIFGFSIYLARKEREDYMKTVESESPMMQGCARGMWEARNGFTTVWTRRMSFIEATIAKIKHAFNFKRYIDD